ncbi:hypothetical protein AND_000426 [Anopheles darlingi]|uniref:Uncharacterized protein n=1 Tax=Anopheles darlingi TaxID=43151 RepID=W5JTK7_ANODA|nr:hypothetical protein AND_000426 [Anopheles darlingi]
MYPGVSRRKDEFGGSEGSKDRRPTFLNSLRQSIDHPTQDRQASAAGGEIGAISFERSACQLEGVYIASHRISRSRDRRAFKTGKLKCTSGMIEFIGHWFRSVKERVDRLKLKPDYRGSSTSNRSRYIPLEAEAISSLRRGSRWLSLRCGVSASDERQLSAGCAR